MFKAILNKLRFYSAKSKLIRGILSPVIKIRHAVLRRKRSRHSLLISNIEELMVSEPLLKVDEFNGVFKMNVHSDLFARIIIEKKYEVNLVKICEKFINRNVDAIDIGANIGFFSVLFAKTLVNGKVLSVEPSSQALGYLYHNLEINGVRQKVEVFEGVVSDKAGYLTIRSIKGKPEYTTLGVLKHPSVLNKDYDTQKVISITLDELVLSRSTSPGFIKIDVEGMEHLVLRGAKNVLLKMRPVILSELSAFLLKQNGASSEEVINLLTKAGYDVFDPVDPGIRPGWKEFGDIICFPMEMNLKPDQLN